MNPTVFSMPSDSWLWQNDMYADVTLHLCTTESISAPPSATASGGCDSIDRKSKLGRLSHGSSGGAKDAATSPQQRHKAARLGGSNATAPQLARADHSTRDGSCPQGENTLGVAKHGIDVPSRVGIDVGRDDGVVAGVAGILKASGAGRVGIVEVVSVNNGAGSAGSDSGGGGSSCADAGAGGNAGVSGADAGGSGAGAGGFCVGGIGGGVVDGVVCGCGGAGGSSGSRVAEMPAAAGGVAPPFGGGFSVDTSCHDNSGGAAARGAAAADVDVETTGSCSGRTYAAHAVVLASCSQYFKTRLAQRPASSSVAADDVVLRYADQALKCRPPPHSCAHDVSTAVVGGVATQQPRVLLAERLEDGELDAMEAVLRFCYTGLLCGSGDDPGRLPIATLLQMATLAGRFGVCSCSARCVEELSKRKAAEFDVPAINAVLSLPETLPGLGVLLAIVTRRLVQLFGDVAGVCQDDDEALGKAFRELGHAGMMLLLKSDDLECPSENDVLLMADMWVNWSATDKTPAQIRAMVEALRLCQLTHAFTFDVLPALAWLQLTTEEVAYLQKYAAAGASLRKLFARERRLSRFPTAWYSASPRTSPEEATVVKLTVSKTQLAQALHSIKAHGTDMSFAATPRTCNGMVVCLGLSMSRRSLPQLKLSLRLFVACRGSDGLEDVKAVQHDGAAVVVNYSVPDNDDGGPPLEGAWKGVASRNIVTIFEFSDLRGAARLDVATWAPYLADDRFSIECEVVVN